MLIPFVAQAVDAAPSVAAATTTATTTTSARPRTRPAPRGEIYVAMALTGGATDWSGDGLGYGGLTLGFRLWGVLTPYVSGTLGYAAIDQRQLTRLGIGLDAGYTIDGRFRPHLYAGFVHQHEESLAAVAQEPGGAVLGIGNGIRHRAGAHVGVGLDVRVWSSDNVQFDLGPDVSFMYLGYSSGPTWYWIGGVSAALHVRLF